MDRTPELAPCLVGTGTLTRTRDIVRALETIEGFEYTYMVDDELIAEGRAALVKLMADAASATILVNGCLFLNVASFRYLTFESEDGLCRFELHGDGSLLTLVPTDEPDPRAETREGLRLLEADAFDPGTFVILDEEDDEEL